MVSRPLARVGKSSARLFAAENREEFRIRISKCTIKERLKLHEHDRSRLRDIRFFVRRRFFAIPRSPFLVVARLRLLRPALSFPLSLYTPTPSLSLIPSLSLRSGARRTQKTLLGIDDSLFRAPPSLLSRAAMIGAYRTTSEQFDLSRTRVINPSVRLR